MITHSYEWVITGTMNYRKLMYPPAWINHIWYLLLWLVGKKYSKISWEYLSAPHVCCLEDRDKVVPDGMAFPIWTSFASHPPDDR